MTWAAWQVTQRSSARVVRAGRSLRLVAPQRVQSHSAVSAGWVIPYRAPPRVAASCCSARRISPGVSPLAPAEAAACTASSAAGSP